MSLLHGGRMGGLIFLLMPMLWRQAATVLIGAAYIRASSKHRVDSELVHFVDKNHQVMTEHLTKRFVDHRNIGLAAQPVAELPLHHAESRFDIGATMVVVQGTRLA